MILFIILIYFIQIKEKVKPSFRIFLSKFLKYFFLLLIAFFF